MSFVQFQLCKSVRRFRRLGIGNLVCIASQREGLTKKQLCPQGHPNATTRIANSHGQELERNRPFHRLEVDQEVCTMTRQPKPSLAASRQLSSHALCRRLPHSPAPPGSPGPPRSCNCG